MSWLLFMDESGHDHKTMPYEVRGGIAIHARKLWPFVEALQRLELSAFGCHLSDFRSEIKGSKLLDKDRFEWAGQLARLEDEVRRKQCRIFLTKGLEKKDRLKVEFTAYGQACLEMARGVFQLLKAHEAVLFAAAIPRGVRPPDGFDRGGFLRKDHVFLLERFFYFLEREREHGVLVMDEAEKTEDRRFVRKLEAYFRNTQTGRYRTQWIVPTPFFVASDMAYPVQVADLCIYSVNWGFRLQGMNAAEKRAEIETEFSPWLKQLQFEGDGYNPRDGSTYKCRGIVFVHDPYTGRE